MSSPALPKLSEATQPGSEIPKGRNVSGRSWKSKPQKRASTVVVKKNSSSKLSPWEVRQAEKRARQETRELQKQLQEERREEARLKKERRLENETRRAENQYKALKKSVQVLNQGKVGKTIKAMSKKQLRQIKKTRLNPKTGVVEFVPLYQK